MSLAALYFITDVVYRRKSGASLRDQAEEYLIQKTFTHSVYAVDDDSRIRVIDWDRKVKLSNAIESIPTILTHGAREVMLLLEQLPDPLELSALEDLAGEDEDVKTRLVLIADFESEQDTLIFSQWAVSHRFQWLRLDDCLQKQKPICGINRDNKRSGVNHIARLYWGHDLAAAPRFHVIQDLLGTQDALLLHFPEVSSIKSSVGLENLFHRNELVHGSVFIIGWERNVQGSLINRGNSYKLAQLWAMFEARRTVATPPPWLMGMLLCALCTIILILIWRVGSSAALFLFLAYALLYPLANIVLVREFGVYIPMFDFIYVGFVTFLCSSYGFLTLQSYRKWRMDAEERSLAKIAELKTNFIALISHDLNTPVAKMVGLMEILWVASESEASRRTLARVRQEIVQLELCVRAVLIAARLEADALNETKISLSSLQREYEDHVGSMLAKLGILSKLVVDDNPESSHVSLSVDTRVLCNVLASVVILTKANSLKVYGDLNLVDDGTNVQKYMLRFEFESVTRISTYAQHELFQPASSSAEDAPNFSFVDRTLVHLIHIFLRHSRGFITLSEQNGRSVISLMLAFPA